ncbi:MAG TPA: ATP-binding protein [Fibrobacteria bacterium]|nr:ATP-binding protein [Fibrobacteria bacterium]
MPTYDKPDITRSEQPLIEDAFTQSDYAINITDSSGAMVKVNEAYLRLYKFSSESEILGKNQRIIRSPLTPDSLYKNMWSTIVSGKVWRGELTNRAMDGSDVYIHLTISPILRNGVIVGYMGFSIDRAQQVLMERQLFHANKLVVLGTLGAGLAHELNNPLASILLDAECLRDYLKDPQRPADTAIALSAAESVIRGAERMRRVLEHLLFYSKKDSGTATSTISLRQLLDDSFLFIERQLTSRGIGIEIEVDGEYFVNGNRTQLESVIHNLLGNSRDAFAQSSEPGKLISIRSRFQEPDGLVKLEYRDNAGGIQADILTRIFEPFFTTKGGDGTGLGLAISKQIIAEHGGSIECDSHEGTTRFTILLPASRLPAT